MVNKSTAFMNVEIFKNVMVLFSPLHEEDV